MSHRNDSWLKVQDELELEDDEVCGNSIKGIRFAAKLSDKGVYGGGDGGVILFEDTQGFKGSSYYTTDEALNEAWLKVQDELELEDDEEGEE